MQELLMIEDDARLAGMVSDYLGQNGFGVGHAPDARSGLARLQTMGIDLVILDLMLPDMDGLQVCQRIRALPGVLGQVPVLMLTAKGDPMDRIIGLEMGADDYLPKPFDPRELLARIKVVLRRTQSFPERARLDEALDRQTCSHFSPLFMIGLCLMLLGQSRGRRSRPVAAQKFVRLEEALGPETAAPGLSLEAKRACDVLPKSCSSPQQRTWSDWLRIFQYPQGVRPRYLPARTPTYWRPLSRVARRAIHRT